MKKKVLIIILALISILACTFILPACDIFGQSGNGNNNTDDNTTNSTVTTADGLKLTLNKDGTAYFVTGVDLVKSGSQITIPSTYEGKPVTGINWDAFDNCTKITSIIIGDGITQIYSLTFQGCTNLQGVTIPTSVTSIGHNAFFSGQTLEIYYTGTKQQWNDIKFESRWNLSTNTVYHYLGDESTNNNTDNTGGTSTSTAKIIYEEGGIYDEKGNAIEAYWAIGCVDIEELIIPSTYNGKPVAGVSHTNDPKSSVSFKSVKSVSIPDSVIIINFSAFIDCKSLISISLGNSVRVLDTRAFYGCTSLTNITIPKSMEAIAESAFYNCTSLENITYNGTMAEWNAIIKDDGWDSKSGNYTVQCTDGKLDKNGKEIN